MIGEDPVPVFELADSEPVSTHGRGVCQDCERNCSKCFDTEKVVRKYRRPLLPASRRLALCSLKTDTCIRWVACRQAFGNQLNSEIGSQF